MADPKLNQDSFDPYATNPFAQGDAGDPSLTDATPFADQLPFRFTQFAINPSAQATSGQTGRAAVARSPFTSGALAGELGGIRSQISAMGDVQAPGDAPVAPEQPVIPTMPTPDVQQAQGISPGLAQELPSDMRKISTEPNTSIESKPNTLIESNPNIAFGLPTKEYQLPSNLILNGMSPIYAAQEFDKLKGTLSPEQLAQYGPMQTIKGYDVNALNPNIDLNASYQGKENIAQQSFYRNLSYLPSTVDPMLYNSKAMGNLASMDFKFDPYQTERQEYKYGPATLGKQGGADFVPESATPENSQGYWQNQGGDVGSTWVATGPIERQWSPAVTAPGGLQFDPTGLSKDTIGNAGFNQYNNQAAETLLRKPEGTNAFVGFMDKYGMGITLAALAAMTGGAAGAAFAPAAGAATGSVVAGSEAAGFAPAATGVAGGLGMGAGAGASAINSAAGLVSSIGLKAAAAQLGLPMDNPYMQLAAAAAGGAASGYFGGGTGTTEINQDSMMNELNVESAKYGMSSDEYVKSVLQQPGTAAEYVKNQMDTLPDYLKSGQSLENISNTGIEQVSPETFMQGAGGINSVPNTNFNKDLGMQGLKTGLGIAEQEVASQGNQVPNGTGFTGLSPDQQASYDAAMQNYNTEMGTFNTDNAAYQQALIDYQARQEAYNKYTGLQSDYEAKMADYMSQRNKYTDLLGLRSKQQGISSQIQGELAGNPYYNPELDLTGIQSRFV